MKVLYINTVPTGMNGITNAIFGLIEVLSKGDNIKIGYVSINDIDDSHATILKENHIDYYVLRRERPLSYLAKLKRIIKDEGYDIVHAHGNSHTIFLEMYAGKKGKCKKTIAHGQNSFSTHPIIHWILTPFFNRYTDVRLACSKVAGDFLFGKKKYTVIRNGITVDKFSFDSTKRNSKRKDLSIGEDTFLFGNIARISKEKNIFFLVDVLSDLLLKGKKASLIIIGDGPQRKELEEKITNLGLNDNVIITGFVSSYDYLDALDLVTMPSFFEGLPISLIEAQANGLKCICSVNVTREANIDNMVTYLDIGEGSIEKWSSTISEFIEKKNSRQTIDMAGSAFNIDNEATLLLDIYSN